MSVLDALSSLSYVDCELRARAARKDATGDTQEAYEDRRLSEIIAAAMRDINVLLPEPIRPPVPKFARKTSLFRVLIGGAISQ